jgi:hypothetical protein
LAGAVIKDMPKVAVAFSTQHFNAFHEQLFHAIPAALASWLLLRRGFAVNSVAAGLVAGTLAGLAGVTMLELHCANLQAPHVMLWHTAVMPVSAAAGALLAWLRHSRPGSGPHERSAAE